MFLRKKDVFFTNSLKSYNKFIILLTSLFFISIFYACEKDSTTDETTNPTKNYTGNDLKIYNFFEEMDLDMERLEIKDNLVVYGDDGHIEGILAYTILLLYQKIV